MNHKRGARARLWSSRGTKKWNLLVKVFLENSSVPFPPPARPASRSLWGSRGFFFPRVEGTVRSGFARLRPVGERPPSPPGCSWLVMGSEELLQTGSIPATGSRCVSTDCPCSWPCFIPWKARGEDEFWCCLQKGSAGSVQGAKCFICCLEVQEFYGEGKPAAEVARAGTATFPRALGIFTFPHFSLEC